MSMEIARQRVAEGARYLDNRKPQWREDLDWDVFDVRDMRYCPLGQLYGHYTTAKIDLAIDYDQCVAYGFDWHDDESPDAADLQKAWLELRPVADAHPDPVG